jgi:hypothetical protein
MNSEKIMGLEKKFVSWCSVDQAMNHGLDTDKSIPTIDQLMCGEDKRDS